MASSKIKGITIEIDGDTTKLGKALESSEKQSKDLQSELKGVNTLLKVDPSNIELLTQKQKILTDAISSTKEKLDTLKDAQVQVQQQFDRGDITAEQYRDFQREIVYTEQKLKSLKDAQKDFGSVVEQQMKVAGKKVEEFGGKVEDAGKKFSGLSTGAAAGLTLAVTSAGSLEGAVNKVAVATGKGVEGTEELKNVLKTIHDNNYGEDYNDIAEKVALVKQNMGDLNSTDLINVTQNAYLLENAFGMDFSESIRGINGLMQNMGLTAEEAFNYMVVGAQNGLDKSHELGDNIAEYSQLWGQAGFSADEMFSILQNGLDSGAYNLDKVNDLVKEMGISLTDGRIEKNLSSFSSETQNLFKEWQNGGASQADVIKSIINDFNNMENEQEALTLAGTVWSALGEDNAMKVITSLGNVNNKYKDTTGSIQAANDQMYSGSGAKAQEALKKIQTAFQTMGDAILPILTPIIEKVADLATKFSNLNPTIQKVLLVIMALVASAAPLLIFVGKIITSVGTIIGVLGKLAPLFNIIKTAISGVMTVFKLLGAVVMANPIIAIITAIVAVFILLWNKCDAFREFWINLWETIKEVAGVVWQAITGFFTSAWETIKSVWDTVKPFFEAIFEGIKKVVYVVVMLIAVYFETCWNIIKSVWEAVEPFFAAIWEGIKTVFSGVVSFFKSIFEGAWNAIKFIWNLVVSYFTAVWEGIKTIFTPVINWFKDIFSKAWEGIKTIWNGVKNFFTDIWNGIKNVFSPIVTWFKDTFTKAWNGITSVFSGVKTWFDTNVWGKIKDVFNGAKDKMKEIGQNIWDGLKSAFKNPLGLKVTYESVKGWKGKIVDALGLDGWPKLSFAAKGAVAKEPTALLTGEYPNAYNNPEITTPQSIMKDTMMDALTSFNNTRYQNGTNGDIGTLTRLLQQYMPLIIDNMNQDIVLDDRTLVGKIAPRIDKELGVISAAKSRGY